MIDMAKYSPRPDHFKKRDESIVYDVNFGLVKPKVKTVSMNPKRHSEARISI